ncbi:ABC transporter substrate-binding protein [Yinghuangia seranimata]|uniref:ABC transporter substrate-binding protein n=1 Tax=Yinghuangia seranimata TaxID=408067 RepID=UPI00248CFB80|nr:ABC transporter substrate-binding protein [Yinghuangia seranimata]MDI2129754.1 ABC transporter substrate-binding protein [Yinghuangia seranimata]
MLRTAAISAVVALTAVGCSGGDNSDNGSGSSTADFKTQVDTPAAKGPIDHVKWSLYAEPQSLDPAYAFDYPPSTVVSNVCESLFRVNPDLKITPALAKSSANPDPLTWVYTLREGVKFHDGTTMTADDVVASLEHQRDPAVGGSYSTVFKNVDTIKATAPLEVTIKLKRPDVLLNEELAATPGSIESKAFLEKAGKDYGNPAVGVNCTGPFSLKEWKAGTSITLKKNDAYWDSTLMPKANEIEFVFIQDPAARANALLTGDVDGGYLLPTTAYDKLKTGDGHLYFGDITGSYSAAVTSLKGALGDVRVRRALSMAIDRQGIVQAGVNGYGTVSKAGAPPAAWATTPADQAKAKYDALPPLVQDVEGAKNLIKEAGAGGKKIVIATSPLAPELTVSCNAIADAAKAIGLQVELKTIAPDAYTALFTDPSQRDGIDLLVTSGYDLTPDPLEFYQTFQTGEFANYGSWSNPEYDAIAQQALGTNDPGTRAELTYKLQEITLREMPGIPLWDSPLSLYLGKRVTGVTPNITQMTYPWAALLGSAS